MFRCIHLTNTYWAPTVRPEVRDPAMSLLSNNFHSSGGDGHRQGASSLQVIMKTKKWQVMKVNRKAVCKVLCHLSVVPWCALEFPAFLCYKWCFEKHLCHINLHVCRSGSQVGRSYLTAFFLLGLAAVAKPRAERQLGRETKEWGAAVQGSSLGLESDCRTTA